MKGLWSFETLWTVYPTIQQNIPEDLNLHCENLGVCVHYCAHKITPFNTIYCSLTSVCKIHFNIILLLCYVSKMVFSLQVFRVKFDIHFSSSPCVLQDSHITKICHPLEMAESINNTIPKVIAIQQIVCNKRKNHLYNSWSENKTINAILL